uniref:Activin_recp domain-containing protein n=1 Tax=Heterorhabditis bacteriophora TaxID=37862 RepID=A0A1I7XSY2_HETBA
MFLYSCNFLKAGSSRHLLCSVGNTSTIHVMDLRELLLLIIVLCYNLTEAIKCKCTKESETVSCNDGVCEIDGGCESRVLFLTACLMLDHPSLGVHYTCHTKQQKDGFCRSKTSKSGASVRICGCDGNDFCNYSYWPDKAVHSPPLPQLQQDSTTKATRTLFSSVIGPLFVAVTALFFHLGH